MVVAGTYSRVQRTIDRVVTPERRSQFYGQVSEFFQEQPLIAVCIILLQLHLDDLENRQVLSMASSPWILRMNPLFSHSSFVDRHTINSYLNLHRYPCQSNPTFISYLPSPHNLTNRIH